MMVAGRNDYGEWTLYVTDMEFHDLHHALRMLLKHPLTPKGDEQQRLTDAADALWTAHCNRTASNQERDPASEPESEVEKGIRGWIEDKQMRRNP